VCSSDLPELPDGGTEQPQKHKTPTPVPPPPPPQRFNVPKTLAHYRANSPPGYVDFVQARAKAMPNVQLPDSLAVKLLREDALWEEWTTTQQRATANAVAIAKAQDQEPPDTPTTREGWIEHWTQTLVQPPGMPPNLWAKLRKANERRFRSWLDSGQNTWGLTPADLLLPINLAPDCKVNPSK